MKARTRTQTAPWKEKNREWWNAYQRRYARTQREKKRIEKAITLLEQNGFEVTQAG